MKMILEEFSVGTKKILSGCKKEFAVGAKKRVLRGFKKRVFIGYKKKCFHCVQKKSFQWVQKRVLIGCKKELSVSAKKRVLSECSCAICLLLDYVTRLNSFRMCLRVSHGPVSIKSANPPPDTLVIAIPPRVSHIMRVSHGAVF